MAAKTAPKIPSVARMMRDIETPKGFRREVDEQQYGYAANSPKFPVLRFVKGGRNAVTIEIHFTPQRDPYRRESYMLASGHVTFKTSAGERTFDRYGVEDSFYIDNPARKDYLSHGERVVLPDGTTGTLAKLPGYRKFGADRETSWEDEYTVAWDGVYQVQQYTTAQFKRAGIRRADEVEQANWTIRRFIEEKIPEARARVDRSEQVPGIPFMVTPEQKEQIAAKLAVNKRHDFVPSGFGVGYTLSTTHSVFSKKAEPATEEFFGVRPLYVDTFDAD